MPRYLVEVERWQKETASITLKAPNKRAARKLALEMDECNATDDLLWETELTTEIKVCDVDEDTSDCLDCGVDTSPAEYYMVYDRVWNKATKPHERENMLCIECLEKRLGRQLTAKDFNQAPVNHDPEWTTNHSPTLRKRLRRK